MRNCFFKTLFQLMCLACLACLSSCVHKYGVLKYNPVQEYEFSSDAQVISLDVEDIVCEILVNYWEGEWDDWDRNPEIASHGDVGPNYRDDLFLAGDWFTVSATHEPLRLEMKIDKNEGDKPRQIEMYVDMVGRKAGEISIYKSGPGYEIHIHQAAGVKTE